MKTADNFDAIVTGAVSAGVACSGELVFYGEGASRRRVSPKRGARCGRRRRRPE
jgi:hypothetical protein